MNIYYGIIKVVKKKHAQFYRLQFPVFIVSLALSFTGMFITGCQQPTPVTKVVSQSQKKQNSGTLPSLEIDVDKVHKRLNEINGSLKEAERSLNEQSAKRLGVTLNELQLRYQLLDDLAAVYQRQLTEMNNQASLKKEEEAIRHKLEQEATGRISEPPPYSLKIYDGYLDQLTIATRKEAALQDRIALIKKLLDEAVTQRDMGSQKVRAVKEKLASAGLKESEVLANWGYKSALLAEELPQARLDVRKIMLRNDETAFSIAGIETGIAQKHVDWVKRYLSPKKEEIEQIMAAINESKRQIETQVKTQTRELQVVEKRLSEAQSRLRDIRKAEGPDKVRALAYLSAQEAWTKTYQKGIERAEILLILLNRKAEMWQQRFDLLTASVNVSEMEKWKAQTTNLIDKIQKISSLAQEFQRTVQSQITNIEKDLTQKNLDPLVRKYKEAYLYALKKSLEQSSDSLALFIDIEELSRRLLYEINAKQKAAPLQDKLEGVWNRARNAWEYELWVIDERPVTVKKVVVAVLIFIVGAIVMRLLLYIIIRRLIRLTRIGAHAAMAIEKVFYYVTLLVLFFVSLKTVNIPLTALTFLGGAFAIGVGFGAQNLLNNFISGFILTVERPVKPGDLIEIENQFGIIEEIGARCTRIRTAGNIHILVPNSSFLEKSIINWTLADKEIRINLRVGVVYGSDTKKVTELLLAAAREHRSVLQTPEPFVLFSDFGDNALIFDLYCWISIQRMMDRKIIESDIRYRINALFNEAGIVIAYPQRDIHLDTIKPLDIRLLQSQGKWPE
jgi:potassium-dependent mechanosensitive channel